MRAAGMGGFVGLIVGAAMIPVFVVFSIAAVFVAGVLVYQWPPALIIFIAIMLEIRKRIQRRRARLEEGRKVVAELAARRGDFLQRMYDNEIMPDGLPRNAPSSLE